MNDGEALVLFPPLVNLFSHHTSSARRCCMVDVRTTVQINASQQFRRGARGQPRGVDGDSMQQQGER